MENLLEEKLITEKWVEPGQLNKAKTAAGNSGQSLWISLVKSGILSEDEIALFLAQESGIPYVKISDYAIGQEVLRLVEENFALQNKIIPLFKIGNTLFVACGNPLDSGLLDTVAKMTGCIVEPLAAEAHAISGALDIYWRLGEKNFELADFIVKKNSFRGFVHSRGAERIFLNASFELKVLNNAVSLFSRRVITGNSLDISSDAKAIGVLASVFLPPGLEVLINLKTGQPPFLREKTIELKGRIVRSAMVKPRQYLLGIILENISEQTRKDLLR